MMKVLIVDDEIVIRLGLRSMIHWEENGYSIIGEASDGSKALELVHAQAPHIVITDIKMPVMDGIELIKEIIKIKKPPKVIVLSSHNDFELVREAMKLGAVDFLLKMELEPARLLCVLDDTREKIMLESGQSEERGLLERSVRKNIYLLRGALFQNIINRTSSDREIRESFDILSIQLQGNQLCCLFLKANNYEYYSKFNDADHQVLSFSVINITEEILNEAYTGYCFEIERGQYCAVIAMEHYAASEIVTTSRQIIDMLRKYINIEVNVGVSRPFQDIKELGSAFREAGGAAEYSMSFPGKKVALWEECKYAVNMKGDRYSMFRQKEKLNQILECFQKDLLIEYFNHLKAEVSSIALEAEALSQLCVEFYYILMEFIQKHELEPKQLLKRSNISVKQLVHMESYSAFTLWLEQVQNDLTDYFEENDSNLPRMIAKAKKYIEEYHARDITLKEVANVVNLSSSYFSNLFTQHTGWSYTDYLIKVRIDKAKELLKQTDLKVHEIGEMVGYPNCVYFTRLFKKMTGETPMEYKSRLKV